MRTEVGADVARLDPATPVAQCAVVKVNRGVEERSGKRIVRAFLVHVVLICRVVAQCRVALTRVAVSMNEHHVILLTGRRMTNARQSCNRGIG